MELVSTFSCCMSSPLAWFLLSCIVIVTIYWNGTRRYNVMKKIGLPGPKPLPFIGNSLDIIRAGGIIKFYFECLQKYGNMFVYWAPHLSIAVADPEMRKEITIKQFDNFRDRYVHFIFDDSKGTSLFAAREENWKRIRNILTPTFSAAKMKLMVPLMEKAANTLITKLQSVANSGKSVNMRQWFDHLALDVTLMTSFGIESDVQTNSSSKFLKVIEVSLNSHELLQMLIYALPYGKKIFEWIAHAYIHWFPDNPAYVVTRLAEKAIKTRQEQLKKGERGRKDLLYLMLTAHESDGVRKLTDDDISAQVVLFMFAGFDTTSTALTNIVFHLAKNPAMQEQLREEIESTVLKNAEMGFYELVNTMEYLDCVVKESLRLFPLDRSIINRECSRSCTINGVFFPAGAEVVLSTMLQDKDPNA